MGELMTEKGEPRPFMGELKVLMGECRDPEGPNEFGLSSDGCIPRWDVGELRGEDIICPEESMGGMWKEVIRTFTKALVCSYLLKKCQKINDFLFTSIKTWDSQLQAYMPEGERESPFGTFSPAC